MQNKRRDMKQALKKIVLVGRMNVGKSTLFNRLTDSERAIVSSLPGTTRDAHVGTVVWRGAELELVDTGGLDVKDDQQLEERVIAMARRSMHGADLIVLVVDGDAGVLPADKQFAVEVRATGIPSILVVNKVDSTTDEQNVSSVMHRLNLRPIVCVSAKNGRGTGDFLDVAYNLLQPSTDAAERMQASRTAVAIIGRPNVGKSSLLNAILGEDRVIVADKAHTTRDVNDIPCEYNGRSFLLIDTAGIRKKKNVGVRWPDERLGAIEKQSVRAAMHAIERADVVLLVLEAHRRIEAQDKKIAQLANERGKGLILVLNKWDLIEDKTPDTINTFVDYFNGALPFLTWAPMVFVSALDRTRVRKTLDLVTRVAENFHRQIPEEQLKDILYIARGTYKPKATNVRKWKKPQIVFKQFAQVDTAPPRFYLKTTRPKDVPLAMSHIIERELRDRFDFDGVQMIIETGK